MNETDYVNIVRFRTFEEWIEVNPDIEDETKDCPECLGCGLIEGEVCEVCFGDGYIISISKYAKYKNQYILDLKALHNYLDSLSTEIYQNANSQLHH